MVEERKRVNKEAIKEISKAQMAAAQRWRFLRLWPRSSSDIICRFVADLVVVLLALLVRMGRSCPALLVIFTMQRVGWG